MNRPSFQFYPADWRNNAKLRRCSEAARGVWMDVLCVLHDSDEYGVCRWPLADLARAANAPLRLVKELAAKEVLKGGDKDPEPYVYTPRHAGKAGDPVTLVEVSGGPCWYSSRFVRDEWVRLRRGGSTQFSSDNQPPKRAPKDDPNPSPKGGIGERQGDGPSSSSSSSTSYIGIPTFVAKDENSVCVDQHTQISDEFKTVIRTARPELDADLVYANFVSHYPANKRTMAKWRQWVANERVGVAEAVQAAQADPDTRPNVEKRGVAVGIGKWDDGREQWPQYKARVVAAERQGVAA